MNKKKIEDRNREWCCWRISRRGKRRKRKE